jgi:membrane protein implicated in regulation of membrane protease activity
VHNHEHNFDAARGPCAAGDRWGATVRGHALVGKVGVVVTAIRGGGRPGEVRVVAQGVPHHFLAYAATPVPVGAHVLVIHFRGARQVDVEPWSPMPDDHTPSA